MQKVAVIIVAMINIFLFTSCNNKETINITTEQFKRLAGNSYNANGSVITTYDLAFEFAESDNYSEYMPVEPKNDKRFSGSASVVAINIPRKFIGDLLEDTITGNQPYLVDAILAQAFEKTTIKEKFIIINRGRYFPQQLEQYVMYEDENVIVYNILPIVINEEYELYLNSQKPIATSVDDIVTYHHWIEYIDELQEATDHVKVVKTKGD